jgi:hypothetical protein
MIERNQVPMRSNDNNHLGQNNLNIVLFSFKRSIRRRSRGLKFVGE